jgi:hypothetical protein
MLIQYTNYRWYTELVLVEIVIIVQLCCIILLYYDYDYDLL